jgi:NhaA family Na+:H+ antiporter
MTDMTLIAFLTGISFTVPVLSLDVALPGGSETEAARLGLAASAMMGPLVLIVSRLKRGLRRETMR